MNRFQLSIIFLFFSIFAASNGDLVFRLTYSTSIRPACIDRMKIVYYGNESLEFNDRFSLIPANDQSPEIFDECKQITVFSSPVESNLNETQMQIEELGRNESVEAIVTKEKLIFYRDFSQRLPFLVIQLKFEDFVPVDHIERLTDQCWKPPSPPTTTSLTSSTTASTTTTSDSTTTMASTSSSPESPSPSDNNGSKTELPLNKKPTAAPLIQATTTSKAEECESLPLWVYVGIGLFSLLLAAAIVACVWFCWLAMKISRQIDNYKKENKKSGESAANPAAPGSQKSLESKSISVKKSVKSGRKESPSKPATSNKSNKSKKALLPGTPAPAPQPSSGNNNPLPPPLNDGKSQIVQTNYENLPPKV